MQAKKKIREYTKNGNNKYHSMYSNLVVKTTSVLNEFHFKMDFGFGFGCVFWFFFHFDDDSSTGAKCFAYLKVNKIILSIRFMGSVGENT